MQSGRRMRQNFCVLHITDRRARLLALATVRRVSKKNHHEAPTNPTLSRTNVGRKVLPRECHPGQTTKSPIRHEEMVVLDETIFGHQQATWHAEL